MLLDYQSRNYVQGSGVTALMFLFLQHSVGGANFVHFRVL